MTFTTLDAPHDAESMRFSAAHMTGHARTSVTSSSRIADADVLVVAEVVVNPILVAGFIKQGSTSRQVVRVNEVEYTISISRIRDVRADLASQMAAHADIGGTNIRVVYSYGCPGGVSIRIDNGCIYFGNGTRIAQRTGGRVAMATPAVEEFLLWRTGDCSPPRQMRKIVISRSIASRCGKKIGGAGRRMATLASSAPGTIASNCPTIQARSGRPPAT